MIPPPSENRLSILYRLGERLIPAFPLALYALTSCVSLATNLVHRS